MAESSKSSAQSRHGDPRAHLLVLFEELLAHDGYGDMKIEIRILKRGQKEVIFHCGKQYRYVIDD